jgi:hypothetical protein
MSEMTAAPMRDARDAEEKRLLDDQEHVREIEGGNGA